MTKIEIFKPFGDAYELMKTILFRPFDLKKWFVIGFAAFLAHIGSGSFQFNYNPRKGKCCGMPSAGFTRSRSGF